MKIAGKASLKLLLCFSIVCMMASCGDMREIGRLLEDFTSQQVRFPEKMLKVFFGEVKETKLPPPPSLVMFVDQSQCSECRLRRLSDYRFLLRLEDRGINVLFIFSPGSENVNEVLEDLIGYKYPYNVWIDAQGEFARMNRHIPDLINFHTFLLDSNNFPVFVGDPVVSDGMMPILEKAINKVIN